MGPTFNFNQIAFFENLEPFFKSEGYTYVEVLNQYRKPTESGFTNVIITPTEYEDVTYFELTFGSRINLVEHTIDPYIKGLKGYSNERNTAITSYGKYHGNRALRLKASSNQQFEAVREELINFFTQEGFDYLKKLEDAKVLNTLFNAEPTRESEVAFNHELRCFRGITLATFQQSPDWMHINEAYLHEFKKRRTPSILVDNYKRLLAFLSNSGLN